MKIKIKNRFTGKIILCGDYESVKECLEKSKRSDLYGANLSRADLSRADLSGADLSGADLSRANLSRADLSRANLSRANLSRADLYGANLSRANLSRADLYGANLSGADLSRAKDIPASLFDVEVGNIYYKSVNYSGRVITSPSHDTSFTWKIGGVKTDNNFNADRNESCGAGLNLFHKGKAMEWEGTHLLKVQVLTGGICVPYATDGKFRVEKLKVLALIDKKTGKEVKVK
jgi:hypothetical protein